MDLDDVNIENEELIPETESLQDSQPNIDELLKSRSQARLDSIRKAKKAKPDGKCQRLINEIRNKLSIMKPRFPLHYTNGKKSFIDRKVVGISLAVLALIGGFSYGYFNEIGKITLVQKYGQKFRKLEDLKEQFKEVTPKHLNADMFSDEYDKHLKNILNI